MTEPEELMTSISIHDSFLAEEFVESNPYR